MAGGRKRLVHVVSHGPNCLDGVTAAAAVGRYYANERVVTLFAANNESDKVIQSVMPAGGRLHDLWITDLSWVTYDTASHLKHLLQSGTRLFWIDHHRTAVSRAANPEFQVPFTGKVLTEQFSAAKLVYDFLPTNEPPQDSRRAQDHEAFREVVNRADDHDRWIHQIPDSPDWALAVQTLGARESYREFLRLRTAKMSRPLLQALDIGRRSVRHSIELAKSTAADRELDRGLNLCTACCFGYTSEAAAELYGVRTNTVVALLDLRSLGVSLRRSADCQVDLSKIAEAFGGGGHAAASGFDLPMLRNSLGEELSRRLGDQIAATIERQPS